MTYLEQVISATRERVRNKGWPMRWGLKTQAKRFALELRHEIDLDARVPCDPHRFAGEYGIRVIPLRSLTGEARDYL